MTSLVMASAQFNPSANADLHHKRSKSTVMKSFIHKRTFSKGTGLSSATASDPAPQNTFDSKSSTSVLPLDHPHSRALGELQQNQQSYTSPSPPESRDNARPNTAGNSKSLHKKTKSAISLKSLSTRDTDKQKNTSPEKPKKSKSSTNLVALFSRPRSSKNLKAGYTEENFQGEKDKENCAPLGSLSAEPYSRPPIYAQFSSQHFTTQPLGGKFLEDEIDLYSPIEYPASKQRDFDGGLGSKPTLGRNAGTKRPMSTFLPSSYSIHDIHKYVTGTMRRSVEQPRRESFENEPGLQTQSTVPERKPDLTMRKRGAKVMAAVAALSAKGVIAGVEPETTLDIKDVDVEFEAMLDRRNIPDHQRHKMRSLALSMKKDFIRQDWAEAAAAQSSRPGTRHGDDSDDGALRRIETAETKNKRPRSRTFTLSKSSKESGPTTPKAKPEGNRGVHQRTKSFESISSHGNINNTAGAPAAAISIAKAKGQLPDDFVTYLRSVPKPELVEVGKLHKLRLLLRNETVAWTDEFVTIGGMKEIVGLLYRTMEVEWREEHEDALLHEVLLCLKALCTTALALQYLNEIQNTLFPALLHMLFDEEKKGPSEFTTRNIVTSLLFAYLKFAPLPERPRRAQILLAHLRGPQPKEEERPLGFVLEMRRDRPYRVWCKEVVNVTKEVFWIFLHNLNVIALPSGPSTTSTFAGNSEPETEVGSLSIAAAVSASASFDAFNPHHLHMLKHFPQELPPVPTAPYVGGVEWDATNYLASHVDLINGIICSLETRAERNVVREQMQLSGWERCMGASLRTCKEKLYGGVHAGLRSWVAAAVEDGWDVRDVRCGPPAEAKSPSRKSPSKKKAEEAPQLEMPKLDFGLERREEKSNEGWL